MAKHRHEGRNACPARDQTERTTQAIGPDEMPRYWSPQLKPIADAQLVQKVRRNLAVLYSLHGHRQQFVFRWRSNRIAALRLIAVFRRESDIDMLTRYMSRPVDGLQHKALDAMRFGNDIAHLRELPFKSFGQ